MRDVDRDAVANYELRVYDRRLRLGGPGNRIKAPKKEDTKYQRSETDKKRQTKRLQNKHHYHKRERSFSVNIMT